MAQTVVITLTTAGADTGPFDLYSNVDGYTVPFETSVAKGDLESGYISFLVPDAATTIRVQSNNPLCDNFIDLLLSGTTTTTSTTGVPTTTTTTSVAPTTTTTTTQLFEVSVYATLEDTLSGGGAQVEYSFNGADWNNLGVAFNEVNCILRGTISNIVPGTTLFLRLTVGVDSPVEFGFIQADSACPAAGSDCEASFVVNATQDCAMTGAVTGGSPIGC